VYERRQREVHHDDDTVGLLVFTLHVLLCTTHELSLLEALRDGEDLDGLRRRRHECSAVDELPTESEGGRALSVLGREDELYLFWG
jgi:hypothetical protein